MPHTVAAGWERLSRVPPCVHFGRWHKPYGPRVMWVQEYPPAGYINSSNCHALSHEHAIVSVAPGRRVLVVDSVVWFGDVVVVRICGRWSRWYLLYIDTNVVSISYDRLVVAG